VDKKTSFVSLKNRKGFSDIMAAFNSFNKRDGQSGQNKMGDFELSYKI
jgi:DUF2075 family protein